jgi:hypothetical protein
MVRVFRQKFTLEDAPDDGCGTMEAIYFGNAHWHGLRFSTSNLLSRSAIEFHAFAPLVANRRVTNAIPLGRPLSYRSSL